METLESRQMLAADLGFALKNGLNGVQSMNLFSAEAASPDVSPGIVPGHWIVEIDGLPHGRGLQQTAAAQLVDKFVGDRAVQVLRSLGGAGTVLIETSTTVSRGALQAALGHIPGFKTVEPDFLVGVTSTVPNDPLYSSLYGMNNVGQTGGLSDADIDAPEAWDITTGSSALVVGIIDTGIDYLHPDLAASIWVNPGEISADGIDNDGNGYIDDIHGYDFLNLDADPMDDHRHGTHVAGTIGAVGNNGIGVTGVAWNVQLMALKFLGANGTGPISAAIEALNYATRMRTGFGVNIRATNNSWGGGGYTQPMLDAITASGNAGMLFIAAAMNNASNNDTTPVYPANYASPNVISVAATDHNDNLASFSDYGATTVDLAAPGTNILSTTPNGTYSSFSGTSMATPHVTGAAALAWSLLPNATYQEVRDSLLGSVDAVASLSGKVATGGRLNARRTLEALRFQVTPASGLIVDETGSTATFSVVLRSAPVADVTIPVSSNDLTEGTVSTPQLTFTPTNWNQPQIVTITGVDDAALDGDVIFKIVLGTASSMDSAFNGMKPQDVSATNRDNETKFYVVNDAASDQTYEYSPTGSLNESYPLDIYNVAPRGVASNAQGTTVWTLDANRTVYVYNTSGARLGSWSASGLVNGAQIEGISTNGTDIWLVDAKADKVYRYAGAAARLSGTQSPISSFALNSGNKDPKDLVTDGVSIWVVNDSSTDKVFKYRISDSKLLGSWTITTPGVFSPTGLTIDPTDVRHIWIVDSGTDRVYQYNDSAVLISGNGSASAVFTLAAGNTNPQGIADPPPESNLLSSAIQASASRGSVTTSLVPPTYGSPAASRSLSLFPNTTSELATQYQAHSANWSLRHERMSSASKPLASGSNKATARLGELLGETSLRNVPNFAAANELDGIFEDWSSDPLQLLLLIAAR